MLSMVVPPAIAMLWIAWVVAAERIGAAPYAGIVAQNSAEAAALGRAGEVLRFLHDGEDPHRVSVVRPEILSSVIRRATTLEAALWSRQLELIQLLDREGALADPHDRASLACLAMDLELDDVAEYLTGRDVSSCEPGRALDRVIARTRASDH